MGPKINLKDRLSEDGEVDLSMSDLEDVPVKEIGILKKAYALDLSNNRLSVLPKAFATLTHITKLDMSKNELKELPENFGNLSKLKHLDLYQNQLQHLPLSFSKLKDLKWLDLKDNPLVPTIAKVAGQCLDTKQCQLCARNVVNFYGKLQDQVTTELETRQIQRQKQMEINQKKQQEEKRNKKKEKVKQKKENAQQGPIETKVENKQQTNNSHKLNFKKQKSNSSFMKVFLSTFVISFFILFVASSLRVGYTKDLVMFVEDLYLQFLNKIPPPYHDYGERVGHFIKDIHEKTGNMTTEAINVIYYNAYVVNIFKSLCNIVQIVTFEVIAFFSNLLNKD